MDNGGRISFEDRLRIDYGGTEIERDEVTRVDACGNFLACEGRPRVAIIIPRVNCGKSFARGAR